MRILLVCLLLFSALPVRAAQVILVYGDSLSAAYGMSPRSGWVALLERRLAERYPGWRVVNASVSGETTAGGLARLPAVLERHAPDIVVLELGANDGLRGLPVAAAAANLERMTRLAQQRGARVLLVGMQLPPNYGSAYVREFHEMYARVAGRTKSARVPFLFEGIASRTDLFQADQLHPSTAAQPVLLETVWTSLAPLLQGLRRR